MNLKKLNFMTRLNLYGCFNVMCLYAARSRKDKTIKILYMLNLLIMSGWRVTMDNNFMKWRDPIWNLTAIL